MGRHKGDSDLSAASSLLHLDDDDLFGDEHEAIIPSNFTLSEDLIFTRFVLGPHCSRFDN